MANFRSILTFPSIYRLFSNLVSNQDSRSIYVKEYIRPIAGDKVLDIGCGVGDILKYLPNCEYSGFDMNRRYIKTAKKRFGNLGIFVCEKLTKELCREFSDFDIALATGILHHLNDHEALELFELARAVLKPDGRLLTFDGCYFEGQSWFERFILSKDRGKYVRTKEEYLDLASMVFPKIKISILNNLIRIPYTHIIMECTA
jgi:SAM-dependent methyltransferase